MAMDAVTGALALVRELKRFWEAYKNKDGTSGHARALVHTCHVYERAVFEYDQSLSLKSNSGGAGAPRSSAPRSIEQVAFASKLADDITLMRQILKTAQEQAERHWVLQWMMNSNHNIEKMHTQLMERAQALQLSQLTDLHSAASEKTAAVYRLLGDPDASEVWLELVGSEARSVELHHLRDALNTWYQDHLNFGVLAALDWILYATMVDHSLSSSSNSNSSMLATTISIQEFSTCLKRYGPLRSFLHRTSCLMLYRKDDQPMFLPFFGGAVNRDGAIARLNAAPARSGTNQDVSSLMILRYTSQAGSHFALSVWMPPDATHPTRRLEHWTITNHGALGYKVDQQQVYAPTLIQLLQQEFLDRYYPGVKLDRVHEEEWGKAFLPTSRAMYLNALAQQRAQAPPPPIKPSHEAVNAAKLKTAAVVPASTYANSDISLKPIVTPTPIDPSNTGSTSAPSPMASSTSFTLMQQAIESCIADAATPEHLNSNSKSNLNSLVKAVCHMFPNMRDVPKVINWIQSNPESVQSPTISNSPPDSSSLVSSARLLRNVPICGSRDSYPVTMRLQHSLVLELPNSVESSSSNSPSSSSATRVGVGVEVAHVSLSELQSHSAPLSESEKADLASKSDIDTTRLLTLTVNNQRTILLMPDVESATQWKQHLRMD